MYNKINDNNNYKPAIHINRELLIPSLINYCLWRVFSEVITQKNDFYCENGIHLAARTEL